MYSKLKMHVETLKESSREVIDILNHDNNIEDLSGHKTVYRHNYFITVAC